MPFSRKSGEDSFSLPVFRGKSRKKMTWIKDEADEEIKVQKPNQERERRGPFRSFTPKPIRGQRSPLPKPSPRRLRRLSSDHVSFSPPIEVAKNAAGRKSAGMHFPASSGYRNILSSSFWNSGVSPCCNLTTDSLTPSPVTSRGQSPIGFMPPLRSARDYSGSYSNLENESCEGDSFPQRVEERSPRAGLTSSPLRKSCTVTSADSIDSDTNYFLSHLIESEAQACPASDRWERGNFDRNQIYKRCEYLEAEVEYLRDRERQLSARIAQVQAENKQLVTEFTALTDEFAMVLDQKRTSDAQSEERSRSCEALRSTNTQLSLKIEEMKMTLEKEREQWSQSIQKMQRDLDREIQRSRLYKSMSQRTSQFTDTADTDISLNDFFEDSSPIRSSKLQDGSLNSSDNNSPGASPRTSEDMRLDNSRLREENKRLKAQVSELEECRRLYLQRQNLDALKLEGNKAFQAGDYEEALKCYDLALTGIIDDSHMRAVVQCNKAATLFNLNKFVGSIASCTESMNCDPHYLRAYQRRASAYEAIGDYASAITDLSHLIKAGRNSAFGREAHQCLPKLHLKARKQKPVDAYKTLELKSAASSAEIKTQYRKLALQYHPDKAQDQAGATEAFRLVSQAYDLISDPAKRRQYDSSRLSRSSTPIGSQY